MADLNQFEEKMEMFLRGEMTPNEAAEFRQELDSDPLLKSEFEMNDAIVNGIKQYRKAQIKERLASISIAPAPISFWAGVGGTAVVGAITATVVYNLAVEDPQEIEESTEPLTEEISGQQESTQPAYDISDELAKEAQMSNQEEENAPVISLNQPELQERDDSEDLVPELKSNNQSEQVQTQVVLPVGPDDADELDRSVEIPVSSSTIDQSRIEKMDVAVKQHPEYTFHYKYSNHKLFIYGSLEKEPYRLLELEQGEKTNLYLAYDGRYYYLKDQTITPEPLKPIKDKKLLKNLRELDSSN